MENKSVNTISFYCVGELSGTTHLYHSTICDCIKSMKKVHDISLSFKQENKVFNNVIEALELSYV